MRSVEGTHPNGLESLLFSFFEVRGVIIKENNLFWLEVVGLD